MLTRAEIDAAKSAEWFACNDWGVMTIGGQLSL